eukprot:COSAG02_NODE_40467_length_405_cov_0.839869_2_plen_67_part_01
MFGPRRIGCLEIFSKGNEGKGGSDQTCAAENYSHIEKLAIRALNEGEQPLFLRHDLLPGVSVFDVWH